MYLWKSIGLVLVLASCQNMKNGTLEAQHRYSNHLVGESSPYLLQHAHNPVDWYPWGDEALEKAQKEKKLMVISVGYAACHWCHVMEEESFEDSLVAQIMNENFVSIKVDREERPDIDKIYMDAAYLMTGQGGWPLNVIAMPDGRPIFAGTYFPKSDWMKILEHVQKEYQKDPERLKEMAEKVTQGINTMETIDLVTGKSAISQEELDKIHEGFIGDVDLEKGGRKGDQKFPVPSIWQYLMRHYYFTKDEQSLEALNKTLTAMAMGGIYDHIGGGFSRYTVDSEWKVPHFEKMLYDNSQLVSLYSRAYQLTGNEIYKNVVMETTDFIKREMTNSEGGFYTSYDADSEGEEGKFYVWTEQEVRDVLGGEADLIIDYYGLTPEGNWEHGKNILRPVENYSEVIAKHQLSQDEFDKRLVVAKSRLFEARAKRVPPALDDKVLTSINALMITGYLDAYRVFKEEKFLDAAQTNAQFLIENAMSKDGRLNRNYKDGKSSINGFLDDYCFLIQAFIGLYEATFDEQWLQKSEKLTEYVIEHFFNPENEMFYYTSDNDPELISRKMELSDGDTPSSNGVMAQNLYYLGTYLYNNEYLEMANQMLINILPIMEQQPIFYSNWAVLMLQTNHPLYEVAIMGDQWQQRRKEFDDYYLPNVIYLGGTSEGSLELLSNKLIEDQTTIYVCQNKTCRLPVRETKKALELIQ